MKILLVAATSFELSPLIEYLEYNYTKKSFFEFENDHHSIYILITGVGALNTSFALARLNDIKDYELAINIGVAGAFDLDMKLGSVVEVYMDRFADLGVEENDGSFTDVFELELMNANQFPFAESSINNTNKYSSSLQKVQAITVNKVHGTQRSIDQIKEKYNPKIESMEGAGFFYACKIMDIDCIQIRSISNHVIPRDKTKWKIGLAIDQLNASLVEYLEQLQHS